MKIKLNTRRILFNDLQGDQYNLKAIPQDSIGYMLDIGAGEGVVSLLARLLHPEMYIVAVEPYPPTYDSLFYNLERMKIKTINVALGNGDTYYLQKERKSSVCNAYLPKHHVIKESYKIKSNTLDQIVKLNGIDPDDLMIKIDCEGAEWYLPDHEPSQEILKRCRVMVMEIHGDKGKRSVVEYFKWITDLLWVTHTVQFTRYSETLGLIKAITRKEIRILNRKAKE